MPPAVRRLLLCAASVAALLMAQAPAQAQYTWRDARGQLHASDQPPPREVPDKDIIRRPAPRAANAASPPASAPAAAPVAGLRAAPASGPVDAELQQRRARAEQQARVQAQAEEQRLAAQRAENCQRARSHLATLGSGTRLARVDERGERVVVDDATRAREAEQARRVVASDCR